MTIDAPLIGLFDSGVGGLTVAGEVIRRIPGVRVLYVADQAHVPYGGRALGEVRGFACAIASYLAARGCDAIVMACNISTATALADASAALPGVPVLGVIAPGVARAIEHIRTTGDRRIGVLATQGTVTSRAYVTSITSIAPGVQVEQSACPRFVPLIEEGRTGSVEAQQAATEYLQPLIEAGCRTIILGCTHYPFMLPALNRAAAELGALGILFVDPATAIPDALGDLGGSPGARRRDTGHVMVTTGSIDGFASQLPMFLPGVAVTVRGANWQGDHADLRLDDRL